MMDQNLYNEFLQDFLIESAELLMDYESNLLKIESQLKSPSFSFSQIEENIQAVFRSVHTIKSAAGMMDFHDIKDYTHESENILDHARSNQIAFDDRLMDVMFDIFDTVKNLIQNVAKPGSSVVDVQYEIDKLKKFLEVSVSDDYGIEVSSDENVLENDTGADPMQQEYSNEEQLPKKTEIPKDTEISSNTIRVDIRRLDELLNTVGELVIGKNRLNDITRSFVERDEMGFDLYRSETIGSESMFSDELTMELEGTTERNTRLVTNLQETTMKLRMVPVGRTFRKFHRLVRDLAKKNEKEIKLEIEGEATEVDRTVIEMMGDPLLHIIRNAIDHGIESPDERLFQGKPSSGKLKLRAFQENNMIVICIEDDGRGIDAEKIFQKAVDKGFIEPTAQLSHKEMLNLIFLPGFSTAQEITDVSGRGVGMDVVKKNILKLNGMIDIESDIGKGTSIILKLPLTLAIIQVLLVDIGKNRYSIPITNVIETLRVPVSDIQYVNGHEAVQIRGSVLPILRLDKIIEVESYAEEENVLIVVAGFAEKQIGFIVDALTGQQDIVIKPFGSYLENVEGISGATILGNGDISLVLDMVSLYQKEIEKLSNVYQEE